MAKVLVTGGSGKLGRAVLRDLVAHGYDVLNVDQQALPDPICPSVRIDLTNFGEVAAAILGGVDERKGPFDAVFCRNVAIYFDKPTQGEVFGRFSKLLAPEAFLYIGHSENLGSGGEGFRLVGKTIYQSKQKLSKREAA